VTAVFTITVNDGNGGSDTQDVTITLTGSNDAPAITTTDVAGLITEEAIFSDSGSLSFSDLDLNDRPTPSSRVKVITGSLQEAVIAAGFSIEPSQSNTNNGSIDWAYSINEAAIRFLDPDETITAVFTVVVSDGQGGVATQDVTITTTIETASPLIQKSNSPIWWRKQQAGRLATSMATGSQMPASRK